jgi:(p)ppGpp synthase/HD superfamily hydrolase
MIDPERYVAALRFAAEQHKGQRVPDSDLPYIVHLTSVAAEVIAVLDESLGEAGQLDVDLAISCALLHDTLEDTRTSRDELVSRFGLRIADGVQALTKNDDLPKHDRMSDSLLRILAQPREVWMVKLADRITNLAPPPRTWSADKCRMYRDEAQAIVNALGAASPRLAERLRARIEAYAQYC